MIGRDQTARLMKLAGIEGARRSKKVKTTRPDPASARHPDLVNREFTATAPNRLWVTDLTFVPTWAGVAYVCFAISGATDLSYTVTAADVGKEITVAVTARADAVVETTRVSTATASVVAATIVPGVATIPATAKVGETVQVTAADWPSGVTLAYQWRVDGAAIQGPPAARTSSRPSTARSR